MTKLLRLALIALRVKLFEKESVVGKLINLENKDLVAMAVRSIRPFVTAPVSEEVVYRRYLSPALTCFLPLTQAIPVSAVLFVVNNLNPTSMLPLTMPRFVLAILYVQSKNLTVTIWYTPCGTVECFRIPAWSGALTEFECRELFTSTTKHVRFVFRCVTSPLNWLSFSFN